ncbi:MAG: hypothetical protein ABIA75_04315 [Candidatus Neomarinimicrobiota bacterium]
MTIATAQNVPVVDPEPNAEKMELMATWRMTEYLKLTSEQAQVLFPLLREQRERTAELNRQRRELGKDLLDRAERGEDISNTEFRSMLDKISTLEKQKIEYQTEYLNSLQGKLTNLQRVRLMMFEERFRKELQQNIKQQRDVLDRHRRSMGPDIKSRRK